MEFKGITVGTYISRKSKNKKEKDVCASCEISKKIQNKNIDKEKEYELCKDCNKCYVSKTCKALITTGRDLTTGKIMRKTFVADTEEQAFSQALQYKLNLEENGEVRVITKSNKTLVELIKPLINEQYKLKAINQATHKRKSDTLKQIEKENFANKPIAKVTREDVVNYLSKISKYSDSTIKQNYELCCLKRIAFHLDIGIFEEKNKKGAMVKRTDVHTHMLRGTFATRCAEAKIAPIVLKQILGHTDIAITMKYYIDVDSGFIESETDNAIQYLVDKNIFGVEIQESNVA